MDKTIIVEVLADQHWIQKVKNRDVLYGYTEGLHDAILLCKMVRQEIFTENLGNNKQDVLDAIDECINTIKIFSETIDYP